MHFYDCFGQAARTGSASARFMTGFFTFALLFQSSLVAFKGREGSVLSFHEGKGSHLSLSFPSWVNVQKISETKHR